MDLGHGLPLGRKGWVLYDCKTLRGMRVVLFDVLRHRWHGLLGCFIATDPHCDVRSTGCQAVVIATDFCVHTRRARVARLLL